MFFFPKNRWSQYFEAATNILDVTVKNNEILIDPAHGVCVSQKTMLHFDW